MPGEKLVPWILPGGTREVRRAAFHQAFARGKPGAQVGRHFPGPASALFEVRPRRLPKLQKYVSVV